MTFLETKKPSMPNTISEIPRKAQLDTPTNIVPLITPLIGNRLDVDSIRRLVRHVTALGHTHLFPGGETGEFRTISNDMRLELAKIVIDYCDHGQIVFGHATAEDLVTTCRNIDRLIKMGADAIVIAPHVFDNADIFTFLANCTVDAPVFLYNNPHIGKKRNISFDELRIVFGKIAGLKDSSGDPDRFRDYLKLGFEGGGFRVYQGNEKDIAGHHALTLSTQGLAGVIASMGNLNNMPLAFFDGRLLSGESALQWQKTVDKCVAAYTCDRQRIKGGLKFLLKSRGVISTEDLSDQSEQLLPQHRLLLEAAHHNDGARLWHGLDM